MQVSGELVVLGAAWGVGITLVVVTLAWPRLGALFGRRPDAKASPSATRRSPRVEIPAAPVEVPAPFRGKAYVIDGDTIEVNRVRIRLFGMDAPELSQAGGYKARSHMIRLAGGREVDVLPCAIDCHGRTVARVVVDRIDLSERMVLDGFAVAMRRWHRDYVEAEEMARDNRQGLWRRDPVNGIGDPAAHRRTNDDRGSTPSPPSGRAAKARRGRNGVVIAVPFGKRHR
jgi:endonuclease YncB( thermonuclease family)